MYTLLILLASLLQGFVAFTFICWIGNKKLHFSYALIPIVCLHFLMIAEFIPLTSSPIYQVLIRIVIPSVVYYFVSRGIHGKLSFPLLTTSMLFVLVVLSQSIIFIAMTLIFKLDIVTVQNAEWHVYFQIFNHLFMLFLIVLLRDTYTRFYMFLVLWLESINKTVRQIILLQCIVLFVILAIGIYISYTIGYRNVDRGYALLLFVVVVVGLSGLIVIVQKALQSHEGLTSYTSQELMQASYDRVQDEIKGFWHSYANIMQVVNILVTTDHLEVSDVKEALREFSIAHENDNISLKMSIVNVSHTVLACILSSKLEYAQSLGVRLTLDFDGSAAIDMNMRDLTEIVGILLDNAIEVAYYADRTVNIIGKLSAESFCMSIENRVTKDALGVRKFGKSNGIGKRRVSFLMSRQSNVSCLVHETSNTYRVTFTACNRHFTEKTHVL